MTKDEIAKLPTPETEWFAEACEGVLYAPVAIVRSLEQRLAAAVMDLEKARDTFNDFNRGLRILGKTVIADAAQIAHDSIDETLAAIRGDK